MGLKDCGIVVVMAIISSVGVIYNLHWLIGMVVGLTYSIGKHMGENNAKS